MKIPLRYNLGSLWVRRGSTLMTVLGIGFTVSIVVIMMSLVQGLEATFVDTGQDNQLVVLRTGSQNEVNSYFNRDLLPVVRYLPGVARSGEEPLAVGEIVVVINHKRLDGQETNIAVRGTSEMGYYLRPEVKMVEGRRLQPGLREINVSRSISNRFTSLKLGESIRFAKSQWKVVGVFDAGGSAYDSEIWADYNEIAQDWDRPAVGSILLRAESAAAATALQEKVKNDQRINLQAIPQKKYYADQTSTANGVRALGTLIAVIMGVGACFAAMNMMYGAVMSRSREIGTLRALGFRRRSILSSFLFEAVLIGAVGGIIGGLMALPMHGVSSATANMQTFSEVMFNFRITPGILGFGIAYAALVGAIGGYLPARRAARLKLIDIMRE